MTVNGQSIYGTTAGPFAKQLSFGRATSKGGRIYLHVFDWPADGRLQVPSWGKTVNAAYLLAAPKTALKFSQSGEGIAVQTPAMAPDRMASVIVLETDVK
jgi:alpha-L-fucosidase